MLLNELQQVFKKITLGGADEAFVATIQSDKISAQDRLSVYYNNVVGSLQDVLASNYPTVEKIVGESFFRAMAQAHIIKHPPTEPAMFRYGAGFDKTIETFAPAAQMPYLPDVACFEWAWNESYHAMDDQALEAEVLQQLPVEAYGELQFALRTSARIVASDYPVYAVWDRCVNRPEDETMLDLSTGGGRWLLIRPATEVLIAPLAGGEVPMLRMLAQGRTLEKSYEWALKVDENFELSTFLMRHFALGTFAKIIDKTK